MTFNVKVSKNEFCKLCGRKLLWISEIRAFEHAVLHGMIYNKKYTRSVMALQKIILETKAKILLTTSYKSRFPVDQCRDILKLRDVCLQN
ncbi:hypothetical protein ATK78_0603 [Pedobacter metabolipauper]|uniref:Uncharacterized protein n=1 Tax=Pedobacter metabolipauper TaxID=425513 RepID=A0A4R6T1V2_9SPHI|nr:hypothetical protein ATK78_0603 [Pedobacter metabolipauper]